MGFWKLFKRGAPADGPSELAVPDKPPKVTDKARESACRVLDHVRLLHPEASKPVTIAAECRDSAMRISYADVPAVQRPSLPECVVVDHPLRTAFLAQDLGHLLRALGQSISGWSSMSLIVARNSVSLLGADIPVEENRLLHGDSFVDHLRDADGAIASRQERLQEAMASLGPCGMRWKRDIGCLRLAPKNQSPVDIPADVLGSYSPERNSWCWAWANRSIEREDSAIVAGLRDRAPSLRGASLLTAPGFDCSEPFAFAVAYLAADHLGSRPIFRWPRPGGTQLFFAMAEPKAWPAPDPAA